MPWFKVDDGFHGHPKVVELTLPAVGLWTLAGSWCAKYLTDGEIGSKALARMGGDDTLAAELVAADLWIPVDDSYQFKDWQDYQPLKADVEAERDAARERMKGVRAKKKGVRFGDSSAERSGEQLPNNAGTFAGTSEEVRVTPSQSQSQPEVPKGTSPTGHKAATRTSKETRLPDDWAPTAAHIERAKTKNIKVLEQAELFKLHAATHDRHAANWNAAFTTWLIKATPGLPTTSSPWSKEFHK